MQLDIQLHNSWEYQEDDWWDWSAFLVGRDLDKVKFVEYILHPTFDNPVRIVRSRSSGFKMDTNGWGTFTLKAIAHLENDRQLLLTHEIVLRKRPPQGNTVKQALSSLDS